MRVLLRNETGLYYKGAKAWTVSAGDALDFGRTFAAMEFARENGFTKAEVVLSFDDYDPYYDLSLPVGENGGGRKTEFFNGAGAEQAEGGV